MQKTEYEKIRNDRDFLYRYFVAEGGSDIGEKQFQQFLQLWLHVTQGPFQSNGLQKIIIFLDKKHDFKR